MTAPAPVQEAIAPVLGAPGTRRSARVKEKKIVVEIVAKNYNKIVISSSGVERDEETEVMDSHRDRIDIGPGGDGHFQLTQQCGQH